MSTLTLENRPVDGLIPYARNPRNNDAVVERMVAAIRAFGFRIPIVAKSDGTVVDGHLRLKAAKQLGLREVPVVLADELTDAQIRAFRLLANRSANWATWDEDLLKIELDDLAALDFDLSLTGFDAEEIQKALHAADAEVTPFVEQPPDLDSAPEEVSAVTVTRSGDLWQLGEHRLLCGDSLLEASYAQLLEGHPADLTVCDPPYNVNYGMANPKVTRRRKYLFCID